MYTDEQTLLRDSLNSYYIEAKERNSSFAQRALAQKLGMSSGALSSFLSGNRSLSLKQARKILSSLPKIKEYKKNYILRIFEAKEKSQQLKSDAKKINLTQFEVISDPDHYAVHALLGTSNFQFNIKTIAERLDLTLEKTHSILNNLEEIGMIVKENDSTYRLEIDFVHSGDSVPNDSLKSHHLLTLQKAQEKYLELEMGQREFRSLTLSANPDQLDKVKELIMKFKEEVKLTLEQGEKTEVYKFNIQLYPISKKLKH